MASRRVDASDVETNADTSDLDPSTFAAVLDRAREGDGAAWAQLYRWLTPGLVAYLRLQGRDDAGDLARAAFGDLVDSRDAFRGSADAFATLGFVHAHRRLDAARRADAASSPLAPWSAPATSAELQRSDDQDAEAPLRLVRALTDDQRQVLGLRVIAELALEDTAAVLGCSPGMVHTLQHAAVNQVHAVVMTEAARR